MSKVWTNDKGVTFTGDNAPLPYGWTLLSDIVTMEVTVEEEVLVTEDEVNPFKEESPVDGVNVFTNFAHLRSAGKDLPDLHIAETVNGNVYEKVNGRWTKVEK